MNIDVFTKYKVKYKRTYCYISSETGEFKEIVDECKKNFNGCELMHFIADFLNEEFVCSLNVFDNMLYMETFNPLTGEGDTISIIFEEEKNKKLG